jgi:hypothetical protein
MRHHHLAATARVTARVTAPALLLVATFACAKDERTATTDSSSAPPPAVVADTPAVPAGDTDAVLRSDGFGPVRVGMTLGDLSTALGEEVKAKYDVFDECDYVRPRALPRGVSLMVLQDTVARVDVDSAGVRTAEGAGVGDTEAHVLELYRGRVEVQPHKYTGPEGHYLVVSVPGDTLHRIIFETDGKVVTEFRGGRRPAVEFVEGCA